MAWDADRLSRQLELGEDSRVEFKEVRFENNRVREPRPQRIADELASFGNTIGGVLIFSVTDAGDVRPVSRAQMDSLEALVGNVCAESIHPPLAFVTQRVDLPGKHPVLVVEVAQSPLAHRSPGGYLSRQGSSTRQLSPDALQRLFQRRGRAGLYGPDGRIVTGTGPNTLKPELVDRFMSSRVAQSTDAELVKLGMAREDESGALRATVAGILLCAEYPNRHIPGAVIEALRYRGTAQGRAEQLDAKTIAGPLDRQIADAARFVRLNTWTAARKAPGRVDIPQFSPRAVFEAIVNAVVHRDYTLASARIRLFVFDDRLELYSPGALPNTLSIDAMRVRQVTRNETLASLLRLLATGGIHGAGDRQYFLEQRGEGVPIIFEETHDLTGDYPSFDLIDDAELRLMVPAARPPARGIRGEIGVSAEGQPLAGATVLAIYPNKTWMQEQTDSFGRVDFDFHSALPITVFCSAPGRRGRVERNWRPPEALSLDLQALPAGGSIMFPEGGGHVPGLSGRLCPILDNLDRMYLYADNVAVDGGRPQPVDFKLNSPLRLTDIDGAERIVRFVDMIGKSALLEYEVPAKIRCDTATDDGAG